jgi:hypothetical protein
MIANYLLTKEISETSKGVKILTEDVNRIAPKEYSLDFDDYAYSNITVAILLNPTNGKMGYYKGNAQMEDKYSPSVPAIQVFFKNKADFDSYFIKKSSR